MKTYSTISSLVNDTYKGRKGERSREERKQKVKDTVGLTESFAFFL